MNELKNIRNGLRKTYMWGSVNALKCIMARIAHSESYYTYRFLLHLRKYEYLIKCKTTLIMKFRRRWNLYRYQKFAKDCGFVIGDGVLGENVIFYHRANIIINPYAKVGEGCRFHGNCCIGVSRTGDTKAPVIGKNVDIGYGAVILGDIYIADNITIGANSVVTKSFYEPGITIAGVPAKQISRRTQE